MSKGSIGFCLKLLSANKTNSYAGWAIMGSNLKRPGGLTAIAILLLIAGLFNVYQSFQSLSADVQALPILSNPELDSWFQFCIPAELAINIFLLVLGFAQIAAVFGLWTGKSYSYKLGLAIPVVLIIINISLAGLYSTAPSEIGLGLCNNGMDICSIRNILDSNCLELFIKGSCQSFSRK